MALDVINLWKQFVSMNEFNMWYYLYVISSSDAPNGTWIGNLLGHQQNEFAYDRTQKKMSQGIINIPVGPRVPGSPGVILPQWTTIVMLQPCRLFYGKNPVFVDT